MFWGGAVSYYLYFLIPARTWAAAVGWTRPKFCLLFLTLYSTTRETLYTRNHKREGLWLLGWMEYVGQHCTVLVLLTFEVGKDFVMGNCPVHGRPLPTRFQCHFPVKARYCCMFSGIHDHPGLMAVHLVEGYRKWLWLRRLEKATAASDIFRTLFSGMLAKGSNQYRKRPCWTEGAWVPGEKAGYHGGNRQLRELCLICGWRDMSHIPQQFVGLHEVWILSQLPSTENKITGSLSLCLCTNLSWVSKCSPRLLYGRQVYSSE